MKHNYSIFPMFFILFFIVLESKGQIVTKPTSIKEIGETGLFYSKMPLKVFSVPKEDNFLEKIKTSKATELVSIAMNSKIKLSDGVWDVCNRGHIWRLGIESKGAKNMSLLLDNLIIPKGAELYVYNKAQTRIMGPITLENIGETHRVGTTFLSGDCLIIEAIIPPSAQKEFDFEINRISHGFEDSEDGGGFNTALNCHHNINCTVGLPFEKESNTVAKIITRTNDGDSFCSGALINNACNNLKPNFLTAFHCIDNNGPPFVSRNGMFSQDEIERLGQYTFVFKYRSPDCSIIDGSTELSFTGATLISAFNNTDFVLLKLLQIPSSSSGINFAGWSRSSATPNSGASIHHPNGDIMKISISEQPLTATTKTVLTSVPALPNAFWQMTATTGAFQGGSSGAPLFDQNKRIVGQVNGAPFQTNPNNLQERCDDRREVFGRFDFSWTGGGTTATRLSNHLSDDPSVITTNTIGIPYLNIPDQLCGNSPMSFVNVPPNMALIGGSISGAYLTSWFQSIAPQAGFNGEGFLELQFKPIGITCNDPLVLRKTFRVGIDQPEVQLYHNWDCSGWVYVANVKSGVTYNWTVSYNGQTYYQQGSSVYLPQSSTGNVYYYLEASTACASTWVEGERQLQGCGGWYSAKPTEVGSDKKHNWKMQLSPNPATNDLTVSLSDYDEKLLHTLGEVKVFNMTGQVVYESKQVLDNTMRLNIQSLNNGIYILEVRGQDFTTRQRFNVSR